MRLGKIKRLIWWGVCVASMLATGFFSTQFFLTLQSDADRALEYAKQMVVLVGNAEITLHKPEFPQFAVQMEEYGPPAPDVIAEVTEMPTSKAEVTHEPAVLASTEPIIYDGKARLAIAITELGLKNDLTTQAINLPKGVALSFSPYAQDIQGWLHKAEKNGHETMLDLAMEALDYPLADMGQLSILNGSTKTQNIFTLNATLDLGKGYRGVFASADEAVTNNLQTILPLIDELRKHNIFLVYKERPNNRFLRQETLAIGLPVIANYIVIDEVLTEEAIDAKLNEAKSLLMEYDKTILIVARPYPITLNKLKQWLDTLELMGIHVAPISEIVNS